MSASWSDIWQPVCVASGSWHQLVTHQLRHIIRRTLMSSITMWYLLHTEHTNQKLRHVQHTYTTYYILTASWNTQPAINIEQLSVNKLRSIKNSGWTLTVTVNLWKFNNRNTRPCNMRCSLPSYFLGIHLNTLQEQQTNNFSQTTTFSLTSFSFTLLNFSRFQIWVMTPSIDITVTMVLQTERKIRITDVKHAKWKKNTITKTWHEHFRTSDNSGMLALMQGLTNYRSRPKEVLVSK